MTDKERLFFNKVLEEFLNYFLIKGLKYKQWTLWHEAGRITINYSKNKPKDYLWTPKKKHVNLSKK